MDPGSNVNVARVQARRTNGRGQGRCEWQRGSTEHCPASVPDSEFFCPAHAAEILASDDPYVHETWMRFQEELAAYRAA
jgi:hypothetical protein